MFLKKELILGLDNPDTYHYKYDDFIKLSIDNQNKLIEYLVLNIKKYNMFPYYRYSIQDKIDIYSKVFKYTFDSVDNTDYAFSSIGSSLASSYFSKNFFNVRCSDRMSPMDVFNNNELLTKAITKIFNVFKCDFNMSTFRAILRMFTGTQMVSNFRPLVAKFIYNTFGGINSNIYDMSCGWGGRLLGFLVSDAKSYIGCEPNTDTFNGLNNMLDEYNNCIREKLSIKYKDVQIINCGSENFLPDKNSIDLCFTSPPYVDTEKYSETEKTQSYIKYDTYDKWINIFLKQTLSNCFYALKDNKYCLVNIANTKKYKHLATDTIDIGKSIGFEYLYTLRLVLPSINADGNKRYEPIIVFAKGTAPDKCKYIKGLVL